MSYFVPRGGLPPQTALTTDRARFTEAYAVIPARTLSDITASYLPGWTGMRMWVLARPLSGFAETFSQYVVEVGAGGGSDHPEGDPAAEAVLFADGALEALPEGGIVVLMATCPPAAVEAIAGRVLAAGRRFVDARSRAASSAPRARHSASWRPRRRRRSMPSGRCWTRSARRCSMSASSRVRARR